MMKKTVRDEREGTKDETQVFLLVAFILSVFCQSFPSVFPVSILFTKYYLWTAIRGFTLAEARLGWDGLVDT